MNFARTIFKCRCASFSVITTNLQRQTFPQRNYATNKSTTTNPKHVPTNLEFKIKKLELGIPGASIDSKTYVNPSNIQINKRQSRKKRSSGGKEDITDKGFFNVTGFSTAEEYDLESLLEGLKKQGLYSAQKFFSTDNLGLEQDVLYVTAKYQVETEARDIYFFREGSVVLWNFNDIETNNVLSFLKPFEKEPYLKPLVKGESEIMPYTFLPHKATDIEGELVDGKPLEQAFLQNGKFYLTCGQGNFLQKYTFSNAIATSIKLGIWEATLDRYIDSMEYLTEDLKKGRRIRISRDDVLRKTGELFALRHVINLSSDLLDTPDFYWDREELETLYLQVCSYFSISRRTKVMNEKINHCVELAELIAHNLNDAHHIRLEWMIIVLIMVEVGFEIMHYIDRFYGKEYNFVNDH